ncbi:MAG: sulfurtransferase TusA family protein [Rhodospirillaceae bacterium]|jgi:tRNA 2-thiouridine synthesizing protein A|nr:sulfurtransferase TusA family protein [Rhodospirillaceae bacterium]
MSRTVMDLKGMNCPLPVLRANKRIKELAAGEELEALVTDRAAPNDFREFCASAGHTFVSCDEADGYWAILIRKKSAEG